MKQQVSHRTEVCYRVVIIYDLAYRIPMSVLVSSYRIFVSVKLEERFIPLSARDKLANQ